MENTVPPVSSDALIGNARRDPMWMSSLDRGGLVRLTTLDVDYRQFQGLISFPPSRWSPSAAMAREIGQWRTAHRFARAQHLAA